MGSLTRTLTRPLPVERLVLFGALAATVALVGRGVALSPALASHPHLLSLAVAADLVVVVPLAWYVLLVRGAGLPALSTLPVFVGSALLATWILPDGSPIGPYLWIVALPGELALLAVAGTKVVRVVGAYRRALPESGTFDEAFPRAVEEVLGPIAPARALVAEWVLLYFALAAWWRRPVERPGVEVFTSHRESAWPAIFAALMLVTVVEIAAVHLLVALWSVTAAWILTGLGLYGAIWLVGDLQALRLRPSRLGTSHLHLRVGLRWTADLPLERIRSIRPARPGALPPDTVNVVVAGDPDWILELDRPMEVRGPLGVRRRGSVLALQIDGDDFARQMDARIGPSR